MGSPTGQPVSISGRMVVVVVGVVVLTVSVMMVSVQFSSSSGSAVVVNGLLVWVSPSTPYFLLPTLNRLLEVVLPAEVGVVLLVAVVVVALAISSVSVPS